MPTLLAVRAADVLLPQTGLIRVEMGLRRGMFAVVGEVPLDLPKG